MRGCLQKVRLEQALLYRETQGNPNPLGERATVYTPLGEFAVSVQPLGEEQKAEAGLTGDTETLRVQFVPAVEVSSKDKISLRSRDWVVKRAEVWQSYSVVLVVPL